MADAFTLATTLPPFLFESNKSVALAPVVSATYEPADFERKLNTQTHLFDMEAINRSVMSGKKDMTNQLVSKMSANIQSYHEGNMKRIPPTDTIPVLGMTASMKSITMKHMKNAME